MGVQVTVMAGLVPAIPMPAFSAQRAGVTGTSQ